MRWVLIPISVLGAAAVVLSAANQDDLPEGKGKEALQKMCTSCHQLNQVTSHKYAKSRWADVVDDMISRGADGTDEQAKAVVSYLASNFGRPVNINTTTAKEITAGLGFTLAQAELLVRYRVDNGAFKNYDALLKVPGIDTAILEEEKKNIEF